MNSCVFNTNNSSTTTELGKDIDFPIWIINWTTWIAIFISAFVWTLRAKEARREVPRLAMGKQSEKFSADFVMGGMAALVAKSAAAPIERVKLLLQNQGEMIKRGQLQIPYKGVGDGFRRVFREEGVLAFWRGNQANVIRYFPTQVPCLLSIPPNEIMLFLQNFSWICSSDSFLI